MPSNTTKHALPYPLGNDLVSTVDDTVQDLAETLDALVAVDSQGTLAARPAAGKAGRYYRATDNHGLYRDDGTVWRTVVPPFVTALPGSPQDGDQVYHLVDATHAVILHKRYRASTTAWEVLRERPEFVARTAANGTIAFLTLAGLTCVKSSTGVYDYTWPAMTVAPAVFSTVIITAAVMFASLNAPTTTGCRLYTTNESGGLVDNAHSLHVVSFG